MKEFIKIGALISGTGTNLQAILDACSSGDLMGKVVFIGSDNPAAPGLARGRREEIPTFVVDYCRVPVKPPPPDLDLDEMMKKQNLFPHGADPDKLRRFLRTRAAAECSLLEAMAPFGFDLLVLAGFMRTLSPYFIDRINNGSDLPRIMNIHPALLPAFPGTDGYGDTFRFGCKVGGCTVHFVDYGEDTGPIIGQRAFAIEPGDSLETVKAKGLKLEWELYPQCIRLYAQGRLKLIRTVHPLPGGRTVERTTVRILPADHR